MSWFTNIFKVKKKVEQVKPIIEHKIKEKAPVVTVDGKIHPIIKPIIVNKKKKYPEYYKDLFVILDNGHGENTPGKRSPDESLLEYKYTREIVKVLDEELTKCGIPHHILVPETKDISLKERVARANKIHKEQHALGKVVILISVHCNAAGNGQWMKARGWSGWTTKGQTEGDIVADCLYEAAHEILDPKGIKIREDNSDGDPDWESNFYIIYKSSMPAVLTENFFQDNKEDVKYLLSDEGRKDVVDIHIKGIQKYADLKFKK